MSKGFIKLILNKNSMPYDLTDNEILRALLPENKGATYYEIAEMSDMDLGREQGRYAIDRLKKQGYDINSYDDEEEPKKNRFFYEGDKDIKKEDKSKDPVNHSEKKRKTSTTKQTLSKKANERLVELEELVKPVANEIPAQKWDTQPVTSPNGKDLIVHETDVHFGDEVTNSRGEVVYNSDIAEERVRKRFETIMAKVEQRRKQGEKVDTVHLLLGGDLLTNEAIYDTQPFHIDETVDQQMKRAVSVYMDVLETLSNNFEHVQVVCTGGNHGEFRVKGSSKKANGDDFIYDMLEIYSHKLEMDNLQFVKTDRADHITFDFRGGKYTGYLTHGDNRSFHIGTSSPESDWLSFKEHYGFDAAFRGHYHDWRIERINGAPVCMTPSQKPGDNFEDSLGVFGKPTNVVYFSSDDRVISEVETFEVE